MTSPRSLSAAFAPRMRYLKEFVVVDGLTRAGKFLMGTVVSAFDGVEFLQEAILLEHLLPLTRFGKIDLETARVLLQTHLDLSAYYLMLGRNLNGRVFDMSSILNASEPERFLVRALTPDDRALSERILSERRLSLFVTHHVLCNASLFWDIFPEARMVQIIRDPVALIRSWHQRGWGRRIGVDSSAFDVNFSHSGRPIPWFAVGWEEDYLSMTEWPRVVRSVAALVGMARTEYGRLSEAWRARIAFVAFEELVTTPQPSIERVGGFLQRSPGMRMEAVLAKQRIPRELSERARQQALEEISAHVSADDRRVLDRLVVEYEEFWKPLAETASTGARQDRVGRR